MIRLKNIKIKPKLSGLFLLAGLIPLVAISWIATSAASKALTKKSFDELQGICVIKKNQMKAFFDERLGDIRVLASNPFIKQVYKDLKAVYDETGGAGNGQYKGHTKGRYDAPADYKIVHDKYAPFFKYYMEQYGYYDVFLLDPLQGDTFFTIAKESDFGQLAGKVDSGLRDAWQTAVKEKRAVLSDMKPYAPSNGAPAQFLAAPIMDEDRLLGIIALQVSNNAINTIMKERTGMGDTGGAYLVGPDLLMRSDSHLDHTPTSIEQSFTENKKMASDSIKKALSGEVGMHLIDITVEGKSRAVLSAFAPVTVGDTKWAILAEQDEEEINAPVRALTGKTMIYGSIILILITVSAFFLAGTLSRPLLKSVVFAEELSGGNLTAKVDIDQKDEVGFLALKLNSMAGQLRTMFHGISSNSTSISSAAEQLSAVSNQLVAGAEEMTVQSNTVASATEEVSASINSIAGGVEELSVNIASVSSTSEQLSNNMSTVAGSINEMSASINDIAHNAKEAANISDKAMTLSKTATGTMNKLGTSAADIGKVTEVIKRIAEQTNLLALNATIEAASAGEAGKGFAVVANEIKELANQSAKAAEDIAEKIQGVQASSNDAVTVISDVSDIINSINEAVSSITNAVAQQGQAASDISANVLEADSGVSNISNSFVDISKAAGDMSNSSGEAAKGSNDVSKNILGLSNAARDTNDSAVQVNSAAAGLAEVAEQLMSSMEKFKI